MTAKNLTLLSGGMDRGGGEPTKPSLNGCSHEEWVNAHNEMRELFKIADQQFWLAMTLRHGCLFLYDCTEDPQNVYHKRNVSPNNEKEIVMERQVVEMGIKESMEVLDFVEKCAVALAKSKEDNVIDWKDLLSKESRDLIPSMLEAAKGGNMIAAEIGNLDSDEINQLLDKATKVCASLVQAVLM